MSGTAVDKQKSAAVDGDSRRKAIKGITLAGGVVTVSQWSKPIVQQVALPAHAATTTGGGGPVDGTTPAPSTTPGITYDCGIEWKRDISGGFFMLVNVTPPPAYPPGATIRCEVEMGGDKGTTNTASGTGQTDANGELLVDFFDLPGASDIFLFPSGEQLISFIVRKSCVNPAECDAECELDLSDIL